MDMWLAPNMPGYEEVRSFYARMAQKVAWNPAGGGMMGAMMSQHAKGMNELVKEMSKIEGIPVVQITRIGGTGTGMPSEADMAAAQQASSSNNSSSPRRPSASRWDRLPRVALSAVRAVSADSRVDWEALVVWAEEEDGRTAAGAAAAGASASAASRTGGGYRSTGLSDGTDHRVVGLLLIRCGWLEDVRSRRLQAGGARYGEGSEVESLRQRSYEGRGERSGLFCFRRATLKSCGLDGLPSHCFMQA